MKNSLTEAFPQIHLIDFHKNVEVIAPEDIVMLEGEGNYTFFYLSNGKKMVASRTLKQYEIVLNELPFIRIHKGYMVNLKHLVRCENEALFLKTGKMVKVSRRRLRDFQARAEVFLNRLAS